MYKPLENKLIIKPISKDKETASGIILTSQDKEPTNTAEVIAVGSSINDIAVGNVIMFCPYSGNDIGDVVQISYDDVLGVLD